jgi:anaerobic magnesium-protoporphyrin IX monomethyl ester cyclase
LIYPEVSSFFIDKPYLLYGLAPPLGLLYIGAMLEQEGHTVTVIDFSAEPFSEEHLRNALTDIDLVGITVLTPALSHVKKIINTCRKIDPAVTIVVGGPHCSLFPEKTLKYLQADICVQGDGEQAFLAIAHAQMQNQSFDAILGVMYISNDNKIHQGPPSQLLENIDDIPFPARHLIEHYVYGKGYDPGMKKGEFTSVIFSRGCPYQCTFCSRNAISDHHFRRRSVSNILEELTEISGQGYTHVAVKDDCFPTVKKEALAIFNAIIEERLDFKIYLTASRVNLIDRELLKKMRRAGVIHIQYGLESGNQEILDYYKKNTSLDQIQNVVRLSHQFGLFTAGSFIIGAPSETRKQFINTVHFAERLPLDSISYLPLRYMTGSSLWNQAVLEGKINEETYLINADKTRGLSNFSHEELVNFCTNAQLRYYVRPRYLLSLLQTIIRQSNPKILFSFAQMLGYS